MFINAFFCTLWEKVDFFGGLGELHSTSLAQGGGGGTLKWNGLKEVDKRNLNLHVGAHMPKPSFYVCEFKPWKHLISGLGILKIENRTLSLFRKSGYLTQET